MILRYIWLKSFIEQVEDVFGNLPNLETSRLLLRKVEIVDINDMFEYASDSKVTEHTSWDYHRSNEGTRWWIGGIQSIQNNNDSLRSKQMSNNDNCVFCNLEIEKRQKEILSNESCIFFQMPQEILIGSGLIVPRLHRVNVFELTAKEWNDTFTLVKQVKEHLDKLHNPDGYNLQWNTNGAAGQHLFHSHMHVIPRYKDEPLVGKDLRSFLGKEDNRRLSLVL